MKWLNRIQKGALVSSRRTGEAKGKSLVITNMLKMIPARLTPSNTTKDDDNERRVRCSSQSDSTATTFNDSFLP
jgi:hypothetical protein